MFRLIASLFGCFSFALLSIGPVFAESFDEKVKKYCPTKHPQIEFLRDIKELIDSEILEKAKECAKVETEWSFLQLLKTGSAKISGCLERKYEYNQSVISAFLKFVENSEATTQKSVALYDRCIEGIYASMRPETGSCSTAFAHGNFNTETLYAERDGPIEYGSSSLKNTEIILSNPAENGCRFVRAKWDKAAFEGLACENFWFKASGPDFKEGSTGRWSGTCKNGQISGVFSYTNRANQYLEFQTIPQK